MLYKILILFLFFLNSCTTPIVKVEDIPEKRFVRNVFVNKGFGLMYDDNLYKNKEVTKKIDDRSLTIFQKNLKKGTKVKITNLLNNKSVLARVGSNSQYPPLYNSVVSKRIFDELELNKNEPYIEILEIIEGSTFIAKKAKTYEEEKQVADKAPVDGISINNLSSTEIEEKIDKKIKYDYIVKVADFYYLKSAQTMKKKIVTETNIKKVSIMKISANNFRVFLGPFKDLNLIKKAFDDMNVINFENLEIIRNEKII